MDEARHTLEIYRAVREAGGAGAMWARAFRELLERHRRDDGTVWTHAALERATGGAVSRHFCSDLKSGRIAEPGFGKVWALALVLGADLTEWTEGLAPPED